MVYVWAVPVQEAEELELELEETLEDCRELELEEEELEERTELALEEELKAELEERTELALEERLELKVAEWFELELGELGLELEEWLELEVEPLLEVEPALDVEPGVEDVAGCELAVDSEDIAVCEVELDAVEPGNPELELWLDEPPAPPAPVSFVSHPIAATETREQVKASVIGRVERKFEALRKRSIGVSYRVCPRTCGVASVANMKDGENDPLTAPRRPSPARMRGRDHTVPGKRDATLAKRDGLLAEGMRARHGAAWSEEWRLLPPPMEGEPLKSGSEEIKTRTPGTVLIWR